MSLAQDQKMIWLKITDQEIRQLCNCCSPISEKRPLTLWAEVSFTSEEAPCPIEISVIRAIPDSDVDCPACIDIRLKLIHPHLGYQYYANPKFKVDLVNQLYSAPLISPRQL